MSNQLLILLEALTFGAAVMAVLMVGTGQLRSNIIFYSMQTFMVALSTYVCALSRHDSQQVFVALAIFLLKTIGLSWFLTWITKKIAINKDTGMILPIPLAMHSSIILFTFAHFVSCQFPHLNDIRYSTEGGAASISLILTGLLFMLTRRSAISQVLGFLTMENGIFLFALTQTRGMPLMIEMGIFLDVLVAVMIAGLIIFKIKHSFEHIDVSLLTSLKD